MSSKTTGVSRASKNRQGPNPWVVVWSVFRSLVTVRRPGPFGNGTSNHDSLSEALDVVARNGTSGLDEISGQVATYLDSQTRVDPDSLTRDEALARWINVYNAGALALAGQASRRGEDSVLGIPGGFQEKIITVGNEDLSLDEIEHAKLRRFRDPRIHAALICGSVSCPTLRAEPYSGVDLDGQLDDQIRHFLRNGAASIERYDGVIRLSRVFLWFGADFVRPNRMPGFLPVKPETTLNVLRRWLDDDVVHWIDETNPEVRFQRYDWGLRCTVR